MPFGATAKTVEVPTIDAQKLEEFKQKSNRFDTVLNKGFGDIQAYTAIVNGVKLLPMRFDEDAVEILFDGL